MHKNGQVLLFEKFQGNNDSLKRDPILSSVKKKSVTYMLKGRVE